MTKELAPVGVPKVFSAAFCTWIVVAVGADGGAHHGEDRGAHGRAPRAARKGTRLRRGIRPT